MQMTDEMCKEVVRVLRIADHTCVVKRYADAAMDYVTEILNEKIKRKKEVEKCAPFV